MVVGNLQFYREESLKRVEINGFRFEIPREWEVIKLIDAADYINGYAFSPKDWKDEGLPIIRIQNLNDPEAEFNYFDGEIDNRYIVENGDLLFSWSASIGVYIWKRGKAVLNQHIFKVVPKNNINKFYLYYALFLAIEQLKNRVHGSTMKHFKRGELKTAFIPLPPLSEQQKIAHILMSIDKAIEAVDEAIAKAERIKRGLMQELLTEGIGHTEFKYSKELGCQIPIKWEILPAEKICFKVTDGTHDTPKPSEEGYYLITSKHLKNNKIDFSNAYFISDKDFNEINKRSKVEVGDVLFSMIGTIGITAIVKAEYPQFAIKNVGLFKTGGDFTLAYWLHYYFQSTYAEKYIQNNLKGTTQKYIPLYALRKFPIVIPPFPEQQKIVQILSKWDDIIELKKSKKEKLERMKKKVMELLLTGKVRVK